MNAPAWWGVLVYLIGAPVVGGLLAGLDRIVTARLQSRVGPPLLQPYYDVLKLFGKRPIAVNGFQDFYAASFLLFMVLTGALFFGGGDLLLVIFALTIAGVFLVLGAYSSGSPYSNIGAERELLQMMAYEPMLLVAAIGMYRVTGSFHVHDIAAWDRPLVVLLPGILIGFLFILTIKLRKSPFDLSTSHHAHQELVKGLLTEFSGPSLALIEISHWYENVLLLGFIYLFFAAWSPWAAVPLTLAAYFLEVLVDNVYARSTWRFTVVAAWTATTVFGVANLAALYFWVQR